jgi:hypothetical protein
MLADGRQLDRPRGAALRDQDLAGLSFRLISAIFLIRVRDGTVDALFGRGDRLVLLVGLSTFGPVDEVTVVVAEPVAMINLFILVHNIITQKHIRQDHYLDGI